VPESIAGPPYPGGFKYSGLALQIGGWATGQQPVTAKKSVRKQKIWPGNSQTEWNPPRQWKSINKMRGQRLGIFVLWNCVQTDIY